MKRYWAHIVKTDTEEWEGDVYQANEVDELIMDMSAEFSETAKGYELEIARLRKGLKAVEDLINDSSGVAGLHLNGDLASWDELRAGGRFEEWLKEFDEALAPEKEEWE
jgi:hypothetical protein